LALSTPGIAGTRRDAGGQDDFVVTALHQFRHIDAGVQAQLDAVVCNLRLK
jgi:hypothetical protein